MTNFQFPRLPTPPTAMFDRFAIMINMASYLNEANGTGGQAIKSQ